MTSGHTAPEDAAAEGGSLPKRAAHDNQICDVQPTSARYPLDVS